MMNHVCNEAVAFAILALALLFLDLMASKKCLVFCHILCKRIIDKDA